MFNFISVLVDGCFHRSGGSSFISFVRFLPLISERRIFRLGGGTSGVVFLVEVGSFQFLCFPFVEFVLG